MRKSLYFINAIAWLLTILLIINPLTYAQSPHSAINLVGLSSPSNAPALQGIRFNPENPFSFDFIVENIDSLTPSAQKQETLELVRYFLTALTIPQSDLWVNLSPYEQDRIIPDKLSKTELGKEMLEQDYLLKQLAASLTYPETEAGKKYWDEINNPVIARSVATKQSQSEIATPHDSSARNDATQSFNKIWIMPGKAEVYEHGNTVLINEATLRVAMEEDYLAAQNSPQSTVHKPQIGASGPSTVDRGQNAQAFRQHILPLIEQEVNTGKNFASVRQIYRSVILAMWFKQKLAQHIINQLYKDKNKIRGIDLADPQTKEKIYKQYIDAFTEGAYDYIKRECNPQRTKITRRHYFSGGVDWSGVKTTRSAKPGKSVIGAQAAHVILLAMLTSGAVISCTDKKITEVEKLAPTPAGVPAPVAAVTFTDGRDAEKEVLQTRGVCETIAVQTINFTAPDGQSYPLTVDFVNDPDSAGGWAQRDANRIAINLATLATTAIHGLVLEKYFSQKAGQSIDERQLWSQLLQEVIKHELNHYYHNRVLKRWPMSVTQAQGMMSLFGFAEARTENITDSDLTAISHIVAEETLAYLAGATKSPLEALTRFSHECFTYKKGNLDAYVIAKIITRELLLRLGIEEFYKNSLQAYSGFSEEEAARNAAAACKDADWLTSEAADPLRMNFMNTLTDAQVIPAVERTYNDLTGGAARDTYIKAITGLLQSVSNSLQSKSQLENLCRSQTPGAREAVAEVLVDLGIEKFIRESYEHIPGVSKKAAKNMAAQACQNPEFLTGKPLRDGRKFFLSNFSNKRIGRAAEKIAKRQSNNSGTIPKIDIPIPPEVDAFWQTLREDAAKSLTSRAPLPGAITSATEGEPSRSVQSLAPLPPPGNSRSPRRDKRDRRNRRERPRTQSSNETGGIDLRKTTDIKTSGQGFSGFDNYQLNFDPAQFAGFIPIFIDSHKITANEDIFSTR